jgi:hypothetical protein
MSIAKRILELKQAGKSVKRFEPWFEHVRTWTPGTETVDEPPLAAPEGETADKQVAE